MFLPLINPPVWLNSIHHDGSELYVSNPTPGLGETVHVRVRTAVDAPIRRILLRTYPDGEQALAPLTPGPATPPVRWWEGDLPIQQPVTHYRFLIEGVAEAGAGVWWYSAAGPSRITPLDQTDFRILADANLPDWVQEAVFYQIFPDRFANGDPTNDPQPDAFEYRGYRRQTFAWEAPPPEGFPFTLTFYGGDLTGIVQRMDYLEQLGVNALYLNPIFSAPSNHKYDVSDYDHVDPHFGGDAALVALRQALAARGMRYVLDIVPNHCGAQHAWFQTARFHADEPEAEFFTFHSRPDGYVAWLDVPSLPKLNYRSAELRRRMYAGDDAVFRRWLRPPFAADGWRVDVGNMLARQGATQLNAEVVAEIRRAVKETRRDAYLFAESFYDATPQLQGDQWDGVMNYQGLMLPLGYWLRGTWIGAVDLEEPVRSAELWETAALVGAWESVRAAIPWSVALRQFNLIGSHDTGRSLSSMGDNEALVRLAAVVQFTYPGVPSLYYGDEIGMRDLPGVHSRGCMVWDESRWNHGLLAFYRDLIALRRRSPILQRGGFQALAAESDTLVYQRELAAGRILVTAHRAAQPRPAEPLAVAHGGIPDGTRFVEHFGGQEAVVRDGRLPLPELAQGALIWEQV